MSLPLVPPYSARIIAGSAGIPPHVALKFPSTVWVTAKFSTGSGLSTGSVASLVLPPKSMNSNAFARFVKAVCAPTVELVLVAAGTQRRRSPL